jgi:hypothetical protein
MTTYPLLQSLPVLCPPLLTLKAKPPPPKAERTYLAMPLAQADQRRGASGVHSIEGEHQGESLALRAFAPSSLHRAFCVIVPHPLRDIPAISPICWYAAGDNKGVRGAFCFHNRHLSTRSTSGFCCIAAIVATRKR